MTTILLIRHAENDYVGHTLVGWRPGISLNEKGRLQAERLAERLPRFPLSAIYSSPLERAMETAAPIARRLGLTVQTCEPLGEIRFGEWTGRTFEELASDPLWQRFSAHRSTTQIPGGEWMVEVQVRMVAILEELRLRHPEATIAAVSHGDPIRAVLLHYLGMPLDLIDRIDIATASVSTVTLAEWGPRVLVMNETAPLPSAAAR